jgi:hypothetical protein
MISYKIIHHVRGRIRVEIPLLKTLPWSEVEKLASIPVPEGIRDIRASLFGRSLVIEYDPQKIDILDYLRTMASDPEVEKAIKAGPSQPVPA